MADTNGRNGDGERMRAIAENVKLQAWARLSMVIGPPIIAFAVTVAGWFLAALVADVKATREMVTAYISDDRMHGARRDEQLKEHNRRIGVLEGRVFGFTPPANP